MTHIIRGDIFGNRPAGNYATFEDDGSIEFAGDASFWDDLRVPVSATKRGGTKDPDFAKILDNGAGSQGVFSYLFDQTSEEELYFNVQIPHSWKYESTIHAHVHWAPTANGSAGQKVSWGLEYSVAKIGSTFGNTTIIYGDTTTPDETLVADRHYLTDLGDISMTGVDSVSPMLVCRVFRDAGGTGGTDDLASDAALLEFDFHFQIDRPGSRSEFTK